MKTVTLIRHGKPDFYMHYPLMEIISGSDIKKFIEDYNNCGLADTTSPLYLQDVFSEGDFFISSDSKRARDSFEMLGVLTYDVSNLFVEAQLPYGFLKKLKMPLFLWAVFLRTIWCLGYTKNCESFREFKKRVKNAYIYLHEKSRRYDHVVIMAHGFVNVNLGRELLKDNWMKVEFKNQNKYFSYKKFSKG